MDDNVGQGKYFEMVIMLCPKDNWCKCPHSLCKDFRQKKKD